MKNTSQPLLEEYQLGDLKLKNRVIMASLTRGRATNPGLVPTVMMAEYYAQRASAGLILSEGTWVNTQSIGFINVPGIYTQEQVEGWKTVTKAVHDKGGLIFAIGAYWCRSPPGSGRTENFLSDGISRQYRITIFYSGRF
ncbi:oxidoreductase [Chryseobacterium wanjuense]